MARMEWSLQASSRVTGMRLSTALTKNCSESLLHSIYAYGFEEPSAIQQYLSSKYIKMFVLSVADEILSCRFKDQIYDIFQKLNSSSQVVSLSATMPSDVLEVTKEFLRDPIWILVKKEELTL
ncbi:hypothetical protein HJG60_008746 [Phyllostomus discolor]|uniref:DEAD/DEAH-box helicase domain-containing protein n=1 Tax=Phyllostomus discolor TaxID=89673 RepID=A0A834DL28_9CHIR|nr:hypothetical protein HJG60_008746 [Phyllostomus discolor]